MEPAASNRTEWHPPLCPAGRSKESRAAAGRVCAGAWSLAGVRRPKECRGFQHAAHHRLQRGEPFFTCLSRGRYCLTLGTSRQVPCTATKGGFHHTGEWQFFTPALLVVDYQRSVWTAVAGGSYVTLAWVSALQAVLWYAHLSLSMADLKMILPACLRPVSSLSPSSRVTEPNLLPTCWRPMEQTPSNEHTLNEN